MTNVLPVRPNDDEQSRLGEVLAATVSREEAEMDAGDGNVVVAGAVEATEESLVTADATEGEFDPRIHD